MRNRTMSKKNRRKKTMCVESQISNGNGIGSDIGEEESKEKKKEELVLIRE